VTAADALLIDRAEGVVTLTLNRPARYNALTAGLLLAFHSALDGIAADREARVVRIRAAGPGFCAGDDLEEARSRKEDAAERAFLEESLRLMQQWPLIRQVNAEVLPGVEAGETLLDLRVRENPAITFSTGYNNYRPPSVGEDQGFASLVHRSLTGNADTLAASYALTDGLDNYFVGYELPLTATDLSLEAYYTEGDSDIIEAPFEQLEIVSRTRTWGLRLTQPVIRSLRHSLSVALNVENKQTKNFLLGAPFSFSPGEQLGGAEVTALRVSMDYLWRRERDAVAISAAATRGVDWFGATDNSDAAGADGNPLRDLPDSDFTSLLVQARYARRLEFWNIQLLGRLTAQLASDPLLPVERLAVGGARTVRGYRENLLVRDGGLIASVELRMPLFRDPAGRSRLGLQFAPFLDYGTAKDKPIGIPGLDQPRSRDIASVGAGLLWNYWSWLYAEAYYGEALDEPAESGNSLQEQGWHLQVSLQWDWTGW